MLPPETRLYRALTLLLLSACSLSATTVRGTLTHPDGTVPDRGVCTITLRYLTSSDSVSYTKNEPINKTFAEIAAGITLVANDTLSPGGTYYDVRCVTPKASWSETWIVRTSASPLSIRDVRRSGPLPTVTYPAGGDLCGTFPSPTVCKIDGTSISEFATKEYVDAHGGGGGLSGAATWAEIEAGTAGSGNITTAMTWAQIEAQ